MATEASAASVPARVIIVDARPTGGRDGHGRALFALDVTVLAERRQPFRTRLSLPVPDAAIGLVHPGTELPAVLVGEGDLAVPVVDLTAAADAADPPRVGTTQGGER